MMEHTCQGMTLGDHSKAICTICGADLSKPSFNQLVKAIERVRELHKLRIEVNENGFSNDTCNGCYDEDYSTGEQFHHDYPCPTIKALDGLDN